VGDLIDIVICTYNRAPALDRCLHRLAAQRTRAAGWGVTIVDNNCTDDTALVVARHAALGRLPRLTRIVETRQGLTAARQRGVRQSAADWVAFVDDDCLLEPDWIAALEAAAARHPEAGGIGGKVIPDWGRLAPRWLENNGWLFARQDHGEEEQPVESLVGAGLVLNRAALTATGWTEAPLLADRIGRGSTSGGDVEISLRLAAAGHSLWFDPAMRLRHEIEPERQRLSSVLRLARGLGEGAVLVSLLEAESAADWRREQSRDVDRMQRWLVRCIGRAAIGRHSWHDLLIQGAFHSGRRRRLTRLSGDPSLTAHLLGRCRPAGGTDPPLG
jgi:glucosyl-dolichyl phosphate glucuronosyltransferase